MQIRHGDLALVQFGEIGGEVVRFDKLPDGLVPSRTQVLMTGSHGNDHGFRNGTFYPATDSRYPTLIGYFSADTGCILTHVDHGEPSTHGKLRTATVVPGIYGVIRQHEDRHEGMQPVVD